MKNIYRFAIIATCVSVPLAVGHAEKLSETAKKLTSSEIRALYAGKSSNWPESKAYFASNGTYLMIAKDKSWYGEGKWQTSGNKVCAQATWHSVKDGKSGKGKKNCWTWYKDGRRYMTLWSGSDNRKKDAWYDGELKKLRKGDAVSATYNRLKSKK